MRCLRLLWLAGAACGHPGATPHDAAPDAAPDAPGDAAPDLPRLTCAGLRDDEVVKLTFSAINGHVAGVPVVYQNVDSSLVGVAWTDASGTACGKIAPGGFVTVIPPRYELTSLANVQPGDHWIVGPELRWPDPPPATTTVALTFTPDPAPGVKDYLVHTTCGGDVVPPSATGTLSLAGCGDTADFLIVSEDDAGLLHQAYVPGVAVAAGGPLTLATTFVDVPTTTYTYAHQWSPDPIKIDYALRTARGVLWEGAVELPLGQGTTTVRAPALSGETCVVRSQVAREADGRATRGVVLDWMPCAPTYDLDVDATLFRSALPPDPLRLDPATGAVSWVEGATGAVPDVVAVDMYALGPDIRTPDWTWWLAAPRAREPRVTFPRLPSSLFQPDPRDQPPFARLAFEASAPGGYDALRTVRHTSPYSFDCTTTPGTGPRGRRVCVPHF